MSNEAETVGVDALTRVSSTDQTLDPLLPYYQAAWEILAGGKRPTADMLVERLGGQKQSAVAGLRGFWATYVPGVVSGRGAGTAPDAVLEMTGRVWHLAQTMAREAAERDLAQRAERVSWRENDVEAREAELVHMEQRLSDRETALQEAAASHRELVDRLQVELEARGAEVEHARSRETALDAALLEARAVQSELREALHAETLSHERTRRELDQARDRAAAAEAAAAQAQQSLQAETRRNERLEGRCEGLEAELAQARERIEAARSDERERQGVLLAELKAAHQAHVAELASKHLEAEQALQVQLRQVTDAAVATQRKLQQRIDRLERARTPDTE